MGTLEPNRRIGDAEGATSSITGKLKPKIVVVDYHKGNIRSVERALEDSGADAVISDDSAVIGRADAVVLPGVGAFADAMETIESLRLADPLRDAIAREVPFLGICLGQHLLFEAGEEHAAGVELTRGLGIFPGVVRRMPRADAEGRAYKIPHVGWNKVFFSDDPCAQALFRNIGCGSHFYFTHSYIVPDGPATIATTTHSVEFPSVVGKGVVFGVQFHPEKSSDVGRMMIDNFVDLVRQR